MGKPTKYSAFKWFMLGIKSKKTITKTDDIIEEFEQIWNEKKER